MTFPLQYTIAVQYLYDRNKKIVRNTMIKKTSLRKYLNEIMKKKIPNNEAKQIKYMKKYYKKYENLTINEFFKAYLEDFQSACKVFSTFYLKFAADMKLHDLNKETFYLDI